MFVLFGKYTEILLSTFKDNGKGQDSDHFDI